MNAIEFGDCRETLRIWELVGVKAQMCVTSPPYFGLRNYGVDGQLGLEQTPEEYVAAMVEVFRCVRDVLADDGVLWLNIGDSYGAGKQLLGVPWRLAFALQSDGWILRQDIIWHKPNPMPESVRDRCTKAHEYVFLLSKSERYFYDAEAAREPVSDNPVTRARNNRADKGLVGAADLHGTEFGQSGAGSYDRKQNGLSVCECVAELDEDHCGPITAKRGCPKCNGTGLVQTRNRRSVWTVATRPYKGAHFAVFPPKLIEPCILAGSQPGDIVVDPFMGSGTTAEVAIKLGRQYLGCELNEGYKPLQDARISEARRQLEHALSGGDVA